MASTTLPMIDSTFDFGTTTSENVTGNFTAEQTRGKTTIIPAVMLLVFGVGGNILAIIILIYTSGRHKWDNFHRLVAALAVSDFIGLAGPLPIIIATYVNNRNWVGGDTSCGFSAFCFIFAGMASSTFAATMSVDRCTCIFFPIFYKNKNTKTRSNVIIILIWILSFVVAVLPGIGVNRYTLHYPKTWCFFNYFAESPAAVGYSYFYAICGVFAVALMLILNTLVIVFLIKRSVTKQINQRRGSISSNARPRSNIINDIYNIVFLVVLMTVFAICWIPLMKRIFINQSGNGGGRANLRLDLKAIHLSVTNTTVDPWIYIILRKDFLIRAYRLITCKKSGIDDESSSMSYPSKKGYAVTATASTDTH